MFGCRHVQAVQPRSLAHKLQQSLAVSAVGVAAPILSPMQVPLLIGLHNPSSPDPAAAVIVPASTRMMVRSPVSITTADAFGLEVLNLGTGSFLFDTRNVALSSNPPSSSG